MGYPKRALNDHYLRDYFNSTVYLMGWRSGTGVLGFADSFGDPNLLNAPRSALCISRTGGGLLFLSRIPFHLPETLKYLASLRVRFTHWFINLIVKHFTVTTRDAKAPPLPKTPRSDKAYHGSIGTRVAKTQNQSHPSFSQNPKQGFVTSNFRRD